MTAKEEAQELFNQFVPHTRVYDDNFGWEDDDESAKICALIAIEFAEKQFYNYCCAEMNLHWTNDDEHTDGSYDHFRYLKEELEKL